MSLLISGDLRLAKDYTRPDDADAVAYIAAVEAADGQALETATRMAINSFVKGCKNDGIWPAIKASCILAGARTLAGALVPLVGAAPTNNGPFVSGDYNRKTGLVGNGSTKYLDANRASNAEPLNNLHLSVYLSNAGTLASSRTHIGDGVENNSLSDIFASFDGLLILRSRRSSGATPVLFASPAGNSVGFLGNSRASSDTVLCRFGNSTQTAAFTSTATTTFNFLVFARNGVSRSLYSDARIQFYSIGESLDLALLDARVTDLINAFAAAIP